MISRQAAKKPGPGDRGTLFPDPAKKFRDRLIQFSASHMARRGFSHAGTDSSNLLSSGREATANPTSSKRTPGQPRSFETGAGNFSVREVSFDLLQHL